MNEDSQNDGWNNPLMGALIGVAPTIDPNLQCEIRAWRMRMFFRGFHHFHWMMQRIKGRGAGEESPMVSKRVVNMRIYLFIYIYSYICFLKYYLYSYDIQQYNMTYCIYNVVYPFIYIYICTLDNETFSGSGIPTLNLHLQTAGFVKHQQRFFKHFE